MVWIESCTWRKLTHLLSVYIIYFSDILYDFSVSIRPSSVCNTYGAFLTFKGARKLNDVMKEQANDQLAIEDWDYEEDLEAIMPTGHRVSLRIDGDFKRSMNTHHSDPGPPVEMFSVAPPFQPVNRTATGGFQCRTTKEFSAGGLATKIGQLQLHDEMDYQPDMGLKIDTRSVSIVLGRYGPFRKQDRKTEALYSVKCFIFSNLPAEYSCE